MKILISLTVLFAFSTAEPPPSNSYLPPPPSGRGNGYPQGQRVQNFDSPPEVVAARSLGGNAAHGSHQSHTASPVFGSNAAHNFQSAHDALGDVHSNGYSRQASTYQTAHHNHDNEATPNHSHHQYEEGYDNNSGNAFGRNSLEVANEPANYIFGYMVNDYQEGTDFGHHEERQEERAQGEYHVVLPDGRKQTVSYEADERGFKPQISYEDTGDLARSGYDSNANNQGTNGYNGSANNGGVGYHANGRNGVGHHDNGADGGLGNHGNARSGGY